VSPGAAAGGPVSGGLAAGGLALPPVLVVSGTGTEVGKTVVTAAVAALAAARGLRVAVVKPVQTGEPPGSPGDLDTVRRLSGVTDLHELARFPDPLSPEAAARQAGRPPLDLSAAAVYVKRIDADLVLVEGAGGLLVRYDPAGTTVADLAAMLGAPVLVVTQPGLGTLNHTALTVEAMKTRRLELAGVVIGAWPAHPHLAERVNLTDLEIVAGQPLAGALAAGASQLDPERFLAVARAGLGPALGGQFGGTPLSALSANDNGREHLSSLISRGNSGRLQQADHTVNMCNPRYSGEVTPDERTHMTESPAARPRNPRTSWESVSAHPVISAVIAILVIASVFFSLYVPLYASATPKIGAFPFFYFYLIVYMPVVGIVLGIVIWLQKKLEPAGSSGDEPDSGAGEVTR
jgi:dethiobiotin synthetase